jgi:PAS domain S-box-containing protein
VLDRPRHVGGGFQIARAIGGAAPALYRLLSDSALNRAALDVCAAPVAIADAGAKANPLVYVNAAFEALFGYAGSEALGRPARALIVPDAETLLDWLPWGGELATVEFISRRKDGALLFIEGVAGDVRGTRGERTHWVLTFTDLGRLRAARG